jgi:hypothetical protein
MMSITDFVGQRVSMFDSETPEGQRKMRKEEGWYTTSRFADLLRFDTSRAQRRRIWSKIHRERKAFEMSARGAFP